MDREERALLAAELLKIGLAETSPHHFTDTTRVVDEMTETGVTAQEWFVKLAHAALAAVDVLYPAKDGAE